MWVPKKMMLCVHLIIEILKNSVLTHFKCTIVREKDHAFAFESTGRIEVSQKM